MSDNFGDRLRKLRKKSGLTQEKLADAVGVSLLTLFRWEKGERSPRIDEIKALAKALGVSEADLLNEPQKQDWVLQIKIADGKKGGFFDMTTNMPVSNIHVAPSGFLLELGGSWDMVEDDDKFLAFIDQVFNSREGLIKTKKNFAPVWALTTSDDNKKRR
ncbi:MAG: helix-turn-helix transcriptional regulator [Synergistaceae bacterium]|nr:helix-turn-helix transcriptional regulator [Synergistaceae bacterium]